MKAPYLLKPKVNLFMLFLWLIALLLTQVAFVQAVHSTTVDVVPSRSALPLGETFSVNITISNVQNLFAVDVALSWNVSVLQVLNVDLRLSIESHPDGILHENLPDYPIEIIENSLSSETGEYHIAATSVGPVSSFSGSGNVAIISFNVTNLGQAGFGLESELADKPVSGEANFIEHTQSIGNVSIIPEFASIIAVGLLLVFATSVVVFSKKRLQHTVKAP